jgi:hypothetical protein
MKITIISATCLLLGSGLMGCSQHASMAPAVVRPPAATAETNTFGETTEQTAASAEKARDANFNSGTPDSSPPR